MSRAPTSTKNFSCPRRLVSLTAGRVSPADLHLWYKGRTRRLETDWASGDTFESNPDLAATLRASGVDEIIAFGIQSECCVESTCGSALAAGFKVTLLSGAHSTYGVGNRTAIEIERELEERLRGKGAKIVPWEEAVGGWERDGRLAAGC